MANLFLCCSCPFDLWGSEIATVFTAIVYRVEYQSCISSRWCLSLVQSCKSVTITDCKALVMKDCIHRGVKFLLSRNQTDFHEHLPVYQHLDQLVCVFAMCSGIPTSPPVYQKVQYTFVKSWHPRLCQWPPDFYSITPECSHLMYWFSAHMFKICTHLAHCLLPESQLMCWVSFPDPRLQMCLQQVCSVLAMSGQQSVNGMSQSTHRIKNSLQLGFVYMVGTVLTRNCKDNHCVCEIVCWTNLVMHAAKL